MRRKVTLKDISKNMNVSVSTVSKALRDSPEISEKTKNEIQAYAKKYNYRPNNIALSLKNQKTNNIGVIVPEIVHHFFSSVINGVERVAGEHGYNVIVCLSGESFEKEVKNMQMLANGSIDGFIISLSKETQKKQSFDHLEDSISHGLPVVLVDRVADEVDCDKVIIDDEQGAYNAVNYLIKKGAKRVALITMPDYMSVGKLRTLGYKRALKDAGLKVDEAIILKLEDLDGGYDEIKHLIYSNEIDAILASTEFFAVTAMKIARGKGIKVPEELAVIGFTDGIISQCASPTLTTVSQHSQEIGSMATQMIIKRLEGKDDEPYRTEVIKTTLVHRESTL
ncbi:LacI family DNA-binding transcriptional regulator [Abyssalbus ytuae]|uniref:LacI family transcriptional regulator n=1 Tax=Abyssalbus ytuae TaxID=2926907 RepID=A0A9E7A2U1_9FLAO|nr:LacI family DNA-binding transcriptional regulator [Abyssalbus ytuae]UOB18801.1 LacI family transcriptional regulator [Abyssalbus ytuae]